MRIVFWASKEFYDTLATLQKTHRGDRIVTKKEVILDAVQMMHQIDILIGEGYKFAVIDPSGNKHIINKEGDTDEG